MILCVDAWPTQIAEEAKVNADNLISYASFVPRAVWAPRELFWRPGPLSQAAVLIG